MNTASTLVIVFLGVGIPVWAFDDLGGNIFDGGDLAGLPLDLGGDGNLLNNGITDDRYGGNLNGDLDRYLGGLDDRYNGEIYLSELPGEYQQNYGSRHIVADAINLIFGLGGHVAGRAGWIVRDALGSLLRIGDLVNPALDVGLMAASLVGRTLGTGLRIGALVNPTLDVGLKAASLVGHTVGTGLRLTSMVGNTVGTGMRVASNLVGGHKRPRDGLLFSNYRLSNNNFGLMNRYKGNLRSHPSQPTSPFDVIRQRYDSGSRRYEYESRDRD